MRGPDALAIGSEGKTADTVWRSSDGGRTWAVAAHSTTLFGMAMPSMYRPSISDLTWADGYWVAAGGASNGYAGVWVSRNGATWTQTLASQPAGSVHLLTVPNGGLAAFWDTIRWPITGDPTHWGSPVASSVPAHLHLGAVALHPARMGLAIAVSDTSGTPDALVTSSDGGATWTVDQALADRGATTMIWSATSDGGMWIMAGRSLGRGGVDAWVSGDGKVWDELPSTLVEGAGGYLNLVASLRGRVVLVGSSADLSGFYLFDSQAH